MGGEKGEVTVTEEEFDKFFGWYLENKNQIEQERHLIGDAVWYRDSKTEEIIAKYFFIGNEFEIKNSLYKEFYDAYKNSGKPNFNQ